MGVQWIININRDTVLKVRKTSNELMRGSRKFCQKSPILKTFYLFFSLMRGGGGGCSK